MKQVKIYSKNGWLLLEGIYHDMIEDETSILIDITTVNSGRKCWSLRKPVEIIITP